MDTTAAFTNILLAFVCLLPLVVLNSNFVVGIWEGFGLAV